MERHQNLRNFAPAHIMVKSFSQSTLPSGDNSHVLHNNMNGKNNSVKRPSFNQSRLSIGLWRESSGIHGYNVYWGDLWLIGSKEFWSSSLIKTLLGEHSPCPSQWNRSAYESIHSRVKRKIFVRWEIKEHPVIGLVTQWKRCSCGSRWKYGVISRQYQTSNILFLSF